MFSYIGIKLIGLSPHMNKIKKNIEIKLCRSAKCSNSIHRKLPMRSCGELRAMSNYLRGFLNG